MQKYSHNSEDHGINGQGTMITSALYNGSIGFWVMTVFYR